MVSVSDVPARQNARLPHPFPGSAGTQRVIQLAVVLESFLPQIWPLTGPQFVACCPSNWPVQGKTQAFAEGRLSLLGSRFPGPLHYGTRQKAYPEIGRGRKKNQRKTVDQRIKSGACGIESLRPDAPLTPQSARARAAMFAIERTFVGSVRVFRIPRPHLNLA